jgi:hypothetical protein
MIAFDAGRGTGHLEGITHVAAARRPDVAARRCARTATATEGR